MRHRSAERATDRAENVPKAERVRHHREGVGPQTRMSACGRESQTFDRPRAAASPVEFPRAGNSGRPSSRGGRWISWRGKFAGAEADPADSERPSFPGRESRPVRASRWPRISFLGKPRALLPSLPGSGGRSRLRPHGAASPRARPSAARALLGARGSSGGRPTDSDPGATPRPAHRRRVPRGTRRGRPSAVR